MVSVLVRGYFILLECDRHTHIGDLHQNPSLRTPTYCKVK